MTRRLIKYCMFLLLITIAAPFSMAEDSHLLARQTTEMGFEGMFSGHLYMDGDESDRVEADLLITQTSGDTYSATIYIGGLPEQGAAAADDEDTIELEGEYKDYTLRLTGEFPYELQFIHGRFTALDDENNYQGHFNRQVEVASDN